LASPHDRLRLMDSSARSRANLFLLLSVGITALLYVVPYGHQIGYPLVLLSTLAHEMGHGIAGILVGGSFHSFQMYPDASGVAQVGGYSGRFARALVSAGGLCGPAIAAAIGFVMARKPGHARLTLGVVGGLLLLSMLLVVRNVFGWAFVGALAAVLLLIGLRANPWVSQLTLLFLSVQLALSVFSRGDYLFTPVAGTGGGAMPSDVANMASALFLPYWFWGAVCGLFSLLVLAIGAVMFLRSVPRTKPRF
jgi:hypothetical protein